MKVDYISDLHLDFWIKQLQASPKMDKKLDWFMNTIQAKGGDVFIIAGDLGHYYAQDTTFLKRVKELYSHVILVPGNHDMYLVSTNQRKKYMYKSLNRILEMKKFCRENDIIYLDGNAVVIDGYSFAGTGMSWDRSFAENLLERVVTDTELLNKYNVYMNDANLIFGDGDHIRVPGIYGSHVVRSFDPLKFFDTEYDKLQKIDQVDVMISHYGPVTPEDMREKYKYDFSTTFFYFDGRSEVERINPKFWVYGHTHDKANFTYKETNMLCNPLGYPGENTYNVVRSFEL